MAGAVAIRSLASLPRAHVRRRRYREEEREPCPHRDHRRGGREDRARARQHPGLDRAIGRGRHQRRRAHDCRHLEPAATARRCGRCRSADRRGQARRGAGECSAGGTRLFHSPQGDRIVSGITDLGVRDIRDGIRGGDFSAVEVADAFIVAVSRAKQLNAFLVETPDPAIAAAKEADAARAAGDQLKPLAGVPIGMKDLFCTKGVASTAGSHILEGFTPEYESTVSQNLWTAGAGMLGKLNMDQFAMGSSNETSYFGNVTSPWRRADGGNAPLAPGGSSGGSSAAVAARICPAATGTDTGGAIRQPASFTGIAGIKPTYGRCSRWGVVACASSRDQAGPFARTVRDTAIMLRSMAGHDPKDTTSVDRAVPDYEKAIGKSVKGMKIGIPKEYRLDGMSPEIEKLWTQGAEWLKAV